MKKKLTALIFASVMVLSASAFLVGCNQAEPVHTTHYDADADGVCDVCDMDMEGHEHIYSKKWTHDNEYHWHKATCAHEDQTTDKEAHAYDAMGICTSCKVFVSTPVTPVNGVYHLEAETAILDDHGATQNTMTVSKNKIEFTESGKTDGPLVTNVGYFGGNTTGQTITWKFNASAAAENVKLTLRLASTDGTWDDQFIREIDLGAKGAPTLKINNADVSLEGKKLDGLTGLTREDMTSDVAYHNYCEIEITVNLVAGENTVVLTSGAKGCNVDKIMIATDSKIEFFRTNNFDRA